MYHYLISLTIIMILLVSPKNETSAIINSPIGKLGMLIFLILATSKNIFLGLAVLLVFISLQENSLENFSNVNDNKNKNLQVMEKNINNNTKKINNHEKFHDNMKNTVNENMKNTVIGEEHMIDDMDTDMETDMNMETTTSQGDPEMKKVELSEEELSVIRNLISQRSKKGSCRKNCGNALLSCLDGCNLSDKMRRPVSSKQIDVDNTYSTENIEPNDNSKEGFTNWY